MHARPCLGVVSEPWSRGYTGRICVGPGETREGPRHSALPGALRRGSSLHLMSHRIGDSGPGSQAERAS